MNYELELNMAVSKVLWESEEKIFVYFPRGKETLIYKGILKIADKKIKPVSLNIYREFGSYVMDELMDEEKCFLGDSISEVFGKMSKYFYKYGMGLI